MSLCVCVPLAAAQSDNPREILENVARLYQKGRKLAGKQLYQEALTHFYKAFRLLQHGSQLPAARSPHWKAQFRNNTITFLYILGKTNQYAKDYDKAYFYYYRCLRLAPQSKAAQESQREIKTLFPHVAATLQIEAKGNHISPSPRRSIVFTLTSPDGRTHYGRTPFQMRIHPGTWELQMNLKGYKQKQITLQIAPRQARTLRILVCRDTRELLLGETCPTTSSPRHSAPLRRLPALPPPQTMSSLRIFGWCSLAIGVLAAGAGTVMVAWSHAQKPSIEEQRQNRQGTTAQIYADATSAVALNSGGLVMFAISGAWALVGAGILLWPQKPNGAQAFLPRKHTSFHGARQSKGSREVPGRSSPSN